MTPEAEATRPGEGKMDPDRALLLVVDDEEELLEIFSEFLQGTIYDLELARTGPEALEKLRAKHFDLVVTDLNLPGADGLAVLKQAKESDPQTEVIVLTGNASTMTAIEALRQGAYDYVLKPFDLFEMDRTLGKALERRRLLAENRRFVENLQRMIQDATLRIRTLYEIGQEITSSLNLERTLSLIVERSMGLIHATAGALFLLDEAKGRLECRVSRDGQGTEAPAELIESMAAPNQEALAIKNPAVVRLRAGGAERSALVVPLLQGAEAYGTLSLVAASDRGFSTDDQELVVSLAAQATIAINNARVYEQIRDLERLKSEFVAVVSHEVRTPLTAIKGTLEVLTEEKYFPARPEQAQLFDICQTNVRRLEALINDILDFSKLESSRLSVHVVDTAVPGLIDSVVVNMASLAEPKRISIVKEIAEDLPLVPADPLRIIQVLSNLLSNAIKFSPGGSEIRIRAALDTGGIRVDIADQGIGIAPEDMPKLFARFRQLDSSSTRETGGTGLGLAISKGIIDEHGGRIWAESSPGQGSTFSFWLPAGAPAAGSADPVAEARQRA